MDIDMNMTWYNMIWYDMMSNDDSMFLWYIEYEYEKFLSRSRYKLSSVQFSTHASINVLLVNNLETVVLKVSILYTANCG